MRWEWDSSGHWEASHAYGVAHGAGELGSSEELQTLVSAVAKELFLWQCLLQKGLLFYCASGMKNILWLMAVSTYTTESVSANVN